MVTHGLVVRLQAAPGREREVEARLEAARAAVAGEPGTAAWFALRIGEGAYGALAAFGGDAAAKSHLAGRACTLLTDAGGGVLAQAASVQPVSVIASKLPAAGAGAAVAQGLQLSFRARQGHELGVEQFLRNAQPKLLAQPGTVAWFALRFGRGHYAMFDLFPAEGARSAHTAGLVPRELARHAASLLGGLPAMEGIDVLAAHFALRDTLVGLGVD